MFKNILIYSITTLTVLSNGVMASAAGSAAIDPLAERAFKAQAAATHAIRAVQTLQGRLAESMTQEQRKMQEALTTLSLLYPDTTEKKSYTDAFAESDLGRVVIGNMGGLPQLIEALLTTEIHNPYDSNLYSNYRIGPQGWLCYPGCRLTQTEKVPFARFLGEEHIGTLMSSAFTSRHCLPMLTEVGPAAPNNIEPHYAGMLVGDYLREELEKVYSSVMKEEKTINILPFFEELSAYIRAAPKLLAVIRAEHQFDELSAKHLMPKADSPEGLLAFLLSDEAKALSKYTEALKESKKQIDMLAPIVEIIEDFTALLNREGRVS